MDETAIMTIQEYLDRHLPEPEIGWPSKTFKKRSYERWAAFEIQQNIMDQLWLPPDWNPLDPTEVIFEFLVEIKGALERAKGGPNEFLFKTAKEIAINILYLFL